MREHQGLVRWALFLSVAALCAAACDVQPDPEGNSEDSFRTNAMQMPINRVVIDHLSTNGGDATDWKYFTVPSEGMAKIVVKFDNSDVPAQVWLVNEVGRVVSELPKPKDSVFRQLSFRAEAKNYYLYFNIIEGRSDYTVEVTHQLEPE